MLSWWERRKCTLLHIHAYIYQDLNNSCVILINFYKQTNQHDPHDYKSTQQIPICSHFFPRKGSGIEPTCRTTVFCLSRVDQCVRSCWRCFGALLCFSSLMFEDVYELQLRPRSSPLLHRPWQLVWGVFTSHCAVHDAQTSPPWSHQSKGNCSRTLVVCSDALPHSFWEKQLFPTQLHLKVLILVQCLSYCAVMNIRHLI